MLIVLVFTAPIMNHFYTLNLKKQKTTHNYNIFSFNTFGFRTTETDRKQYENLREIHSYINEHDITIANFQEYPMKGKKHAKYYDLLEKTLNHKYKELSEYDAGDKSTNFILVTSSKYPILRKNTLSYNDLPFAMYCDVEFPEGLVRVFNVHLQSVKLTSEKKILMFDKDQDLMTDLKQAKDAVRKLKVAFIHREKQSLIIADSISASPYPVIITGDFNDTPVSFSYRVLSKDLKDASDWAVSGFKRTYKYSRFPLQIDYILHNSQIKSSGYHTIKSDISDHYAVATNFKIRIE